MSKVGQMKAFRDGALWILDKVKKDFKAVQEQVQEVMLDLPRECLENYFERSVNATQQSFQKVLRKFKRYKSQVQEKVEDSCYEAQMNKEQAFTEDAGINDPEFQEFRIKFDGKYRSAPGPVG